MEQTSWTTGDGSLSTTLLGSDHLYASHINELRTTVNTVESHLTRIATKVVGRSEPADYICDGTADDVQIQTAINAVSTAGGGIVFIKEGNYSVGNIAYTGGLFPGLAYYSMMVKSKVAVIGAGIGKTVIDLPSFVVGTGHRNSVFVNEAEGDVDIVIRDMTITTPTPLAGVGVAYWSSGVGMCGVTRLILKNIRMVNCSWWLRADTDSYNATTKEYTTTFNDGLVDNVITEQFVGSCGYQYAKGGSIRNCKFYGFQDDALIIVGAWQHGNIIECLFDGQLKTTAGAATGCLYFANDSSVSADLDVISDIKVIGSTFRRLNGLTDGGAQAGITIAYCKNISILGNTIEQNQRGIYNNGGAQTENIIIADNIIRNNIGVGIQWGSSAQANLHKHINVHDNKIYNNTDAGILFHARDAGSTMDSIHIHDNDIWDNQGTITQTIGIQAQVDNATSVATNVNIHDNTIQNATTPISLPVGSGSMTAKVRNNTGYVTENSGTGTIASGATSAIITHGLSRTPTLEDISIVGGENPTTDVGTIWVDTIGATYFTVNCEVAPSTSNFDFGWKAIITRTTF